MKLTVFFKPETSIVSIQNLEGVLRELSFVETLQANYSEEKSSQDRDWSGMTVNTILTRLGVQNASHTTVARLQDAIQEKALIRVIKEVRDISGLGLTEAKNFVESMLK